MAKQMEKPWAEIDDDWRRKEERALVQRAANAAAARKGEPLPYPNPLGTIGPTKLSREATPEEYQRWFLEFRKTCRPCQPKRHTI